MYNPEIHQRHSIRLREFDYSGTGAYFLTICTQGRECLFGEIQDGEMFPHGAGRVVESWWQNVSGHFTNVVVDEYMIMPNHFHGIVFFVGAGFPRPFTDLMTPRNQGGETPPLRSPTLGQVVGYFKYQTMKQINQMRDNPGVPVWQRNYYERIIRDEAELTAIRDYVLANPANWGEDKEKPDFIAAELPIS
jgi:REP element-mobilizing transposase RayT